MKKILLALLLLSTPASAEIIQYSPNLAGQITAIPVPVNQGGTGSTTGSSTGLIFGTTATLTGPHVSGDLTTGLFSDTASTVSVAVSGTKEAFFNPNGIQLNQSFQTSIGFYGAMSGVSSNSSVSTTSGSYTLTLSGLSSANIGNPIVIFSPNTTNVFQSTVTGVNGSTVTLVDAIDVTATNRVAYWGTDSTSAIDGALGYAAANNGCVYIPSGNYFYQGTGLSSTSWGHPCIYGDGREVSQIFLGAGKYLLDLNNSETDALIHDFRVYGGSGVFRNRYASTNVTKGHYFFNLDSSQHSACAISFNASDMPYIHIQDNIFYGLNTTNSMNFCAPGDGPDYFQNNANENQVAAIKRGFGGHNDVISGNDFIEYTYPNPRSSNTRTALWFVPGVNSQHGFSHVFGNKFGNENLDTQDVRVLYADTASPSGGQYFGDTLWRTASSTGYANGIDFHDNVIYGGVSGGVGSGVNPIIYSYTPNFQKNKISGQLSGTDPGFIVQFDPSVTNFSSLDNQSNVFGPFVMGAQSNGDPSGTTSIKLSNVEGWGQTIDPNGDFNYSDANVLDPFSRGNSSAGFTNVLTTGIVSFTATGGSATQITDAAGGTNAVTFKTTATGSGKSLYAATATTPPIGVQTFAYFELRQSATGTPMTEIDVQIADGNRSALTTKRVQVTSNWVPHTIAYTYSSTPANAPPVLQFVTTSKSVNGGTVDIGQVVYYTAPNPLSSGKFLLPILGTTGSFSGALATTGLTGTTATLSGVLTASSFAGAGTGLTGTAASLTAGNVATNANLTGPITSSGNATSLAAQTGTGTTFVVSNSPTITGTLTAGTFVPTGSTAPTNGIYYPVSNTLGFAGNGNQVATLSNNAIFNLTGTTTAGQTYNSYKINGNLALWIDGTATGNRNTVVGISGFPTTVLADGGNGGLNGTRSVAIGYQALNVMSTGYGNVAVGSLAGSAITTGIDNVGVGRGAGNGITTGGYNTVLGGNAAAMISTQSSNTVVGWGALGAGSANSSANGTFIGYQAGSGMTGGTGNILVGYNVTLASTATASNQIDLGGAFRATAGTLVGSYTAPTISSGFCSTSPSIPNANGTWAFTINVGTSCSGSTGTLSMPAAATGWACSFQDVTTPASYVISQTGGATNTVTLTSYARTTGIASNFTASDIIRASCHAY